MSGPLGSPRSRAGRSGQPRVSFKYRPIVGTQTHPTESDTLLDTEQLHWLDLRAAGEAAQGLAGGDPALGQLGAANHIQARAGAEVWQTLLSETIQKALSIQKEIEFDLRRVGPGEEEQPVVEHGECGLLLAHSGLTDVCWSALAMQNFYNWGIYYPIYKIGWGYFNIKLLYSTLTLNIRPKAWSETIGLLMPLLAAASSLLGYRNVPRSQGHS